MGRLDIVRMIVSPSSAHSFRVPMIRDHIVIVCEFLLADCAYASLLPDFAVQQLPHLSWLSQFAVSQGMVGIFNSLNSKSDHLWFREKLAATADERFVDWTKLISTKSHDIPLICICETEK
jgi:hypothetical protein